MRYEIEVNGRRRRVNVQRTDGRLSVAVDDRTWVVDAARVGAHTLSLITRPGGAAGSGAIDAETPAGGQSHEILLTGTGAMTAYVRGLPVAVVLNGRRRAGPAADGSLGSGPQRILAPMPGKVVRLLVKAGDVVQARQAVVVIEAMKMENELRSGREGRVVELAVRDGQSVDAGALLAVIADI